MQRAVWDHVRWRLAPGAFVFAVPNGGARSPVEAAIMAGQGVVAGVPDLITIRGGQVFGLELKAPGGRLSPAQIACHERMRAAGAIVATACSLDEALRLMETWQLLRGVAQRRQPAA